MKIFFDTAFTGLHKKTDLISIGLISEDQRIFYGECIDYDREQCGEWIHENVIRHLNSAKYPEVKDLKYIPNYHVGTKYDIRFALLTWFQQFDTVELVSDVCHYDMVLFIDLLATSLDFPDIFYPVGFICPSCHDINQDIARYYDLSQQEAFDKSREDILWDKYKENSIPGEKHNALYDARVIREVYQIVNHVDFSKR